MISFAFLTAVGAHVAFYMPGNPVPITLQTYFVLLSGLALGSRRAAVSQLLYLAAGAAGLPVFAGARGGLAVLAGPSAGYLLAFVLAAAIAGQARELRGWLRKILLLSVATLVIFAGGVAVLALWMFATREGLLIGSSPFFSPVGGAVKGAFVLGALPFIPGAVIKIAAAMATGQGVSILRDRLPRQGA